MYYLTQSEGVCGSRVCGMAQRRVWRRPGTHGNEREGAVRGDGDPRRMKELGARADSVVGASRAAASDRGDLPGDNVGRRGRGRRHRRRLRGRQREAWPAVRAVGAVRAAASGGTVAAILAVAVLVIGTPRSRRVLAARVRAEHGRRGWL